MTLFKFLSVTLCATFFCACNYISVPKKKSNKILTGEQTAKAAGDSARDAAKNGNTGILVESSNDFAEKKIEPESQPTKTVESQMEVVSGKKLYLFHCASCHGEKGQLGQKPLTSGTVDEIREITSEGRPKLGMPAWKESLSAEELNAVAQYVFTFQSPNN